MEGLTCSWPPSQTWMLLSQVGLTTPIPFHCNPECVGFAWLQPTSAILYTRNFLFTSRWVWPVLLALFRWPVPMESTRCGILLSLHNGFFCDCVHVCSVVRWQGSDSELECVAPHWIGGQEFPTTKNSQTGSVNNQSSSSGSSSLQNTPNQPLI